MGLTGPGATAATRGALVTVGGPAIDLTAWSRLHVLDDLDRALDLLEKRLLQRFRVPDQNAVDDVETLLQEETPPKRLFLRSS